MKISVIICTHNPRRDYLERTLTGIREQTLPKDQWEMLLIDNASKEVLADKWDLTWHPDARHIREEELGLTPARLCGIREAKGELLVFVDDDNVLQTNYLALTMELMTAHSNLGCIGAGRIVPDFEVEPSDEMRPYVGMLALRDLPRSIWSNEPGDSNVPWGAGLVVRMGVAKAHHEMLINSDIAKMLDRRGDTLESGGDDDFSWTASKCGFGIGIFRELKITHLINRSRVEPDYLKRICEGHAFSNTILKWRHLDIVPSESRDIPFLEVIRFLFKGQVSGFFSSGSQWWSHKRRRPSPDGMAQARAKGVRRALNFIQTIQTTPRV